MLRGDSLFAQFDTLRSAKDTAEKPNIRDIRSFGHASSLFQVPSRQGPKFPPEINYALGQSIRVVFDSGAVRNVQVDSSVFGVYLAVEVDSLSDSTKGKAQGRASAKKPAPKLPVKTPVKPPSNPPAVPDRIDPFRRT